MTHSYKTRKVDKKQRRCQAIIENECNIRSSAQPTRFVGVLNAGLSTSLTEEAVLAAAVPHGNVAQLLMMPNKSYSFIECVSVTDAERIFEAMHSVAPIGQNGAITFLAYFEQLPATNENKWKGPLPKGVFLLHDFVNEEEEKLLLRAIGWDDEVPDTVTEDQQLKHRRVKHFGYEFLYGINNVDEHKPLERNIPRECDALWPRLKFEGSKLGLQMDWLEPDQLTVNEYSPGQGIPPHVDTHSAFLDPILALSLQGDIVMDFRRGSERVSVALPGRSLLIMSGEARYDWTHGITPRILDVVPTESGALTTKVRTQRTSLTFRRLRRGLCNCAFPIMCDTQQQLTAAGQKSKDVPEDVAIRLEERNVHSVYEQIANHFSETRHTPWPQVASFLDTFEMGSVIVDVGCGNGKYLRCNQDSLTVGCDRSFGLLNTCVKRGCSVFRCDCLEVPIRSGSVDGCISIAVIHHLATAERRLEAVREMARLLRSGGRGLIYVWAKDQKKGDKKSSYLLQNKAVNKHKATEEQQRQSATQEIKAKMEIQNNALELPIHTNRTDFLQQDVLVPWKLKSEEEPSKATTFLRYYHVFEQGELEKLLEQVQDVVLVRSYYDQGNHCVVFQRK